MGSFKLKSQQILRKRSNLLLSLKEFNGFSAKYLEDSIGLMLVSQQKKRNLKKERLLHQQHQKLKRKKRRNQRILITVL